MNRKWIVAAGLSIAVIAAVTVATTTAKKPNIRDDAPSREEVIRQARERGIEGTVHVPDRAPINEDAEPFRHGPFLAIPYGWDGEETNEYEPIDNPSPPGPSAVTTEDARKSPLWREPRYIPADYQFERADSEDINRHVRLLYKSPRDGIEIMIWHPQGFPLRVWFFANDNSQVADAIEIEGMPAIVMHDPTGKLPGPGVTLFAYDEAENIAYVVQTGDLIDAAEASRILLGLR